MNRKVLLGLLLVAALAGCGHAKLDYQVSDGRMVEKHITFTPLAVSVDTWAESEPGSGAMAPLSQAALPGVAQAATAAAVQSLLGILGGFVIPGVGNGVVNVIATGGSGGAAAAVVN